MSRDMGLTRRRGWGLGLRRSSWRRSPEGDAVAAIAARGRPGVG